LRTQSVLEYPPTSVICAEREHKSSGMRRPSLFISIAAWILVAGCGSTSVKVERQADTEAFAGEHIVVLLSRYSREGIEVKDLSSIEASLEWCIRTETQRVNDKQLFLPPADLRKLVSADTMDANGSKSPDSLLRSLGEPVTARHLAEAKVRYLVLLEGSYSTSNSRWSSGASQGGFAIAKEWTQYSSIQATILDLKHARIAGSIVSYSTGKEGGGAGVFIIIPFPIYFTSMPESRACAALGKELARFISG
jgi:hypothetical protein